MVVREIGRSTMYHISNSRMPSSDKTPLYCCLVANPHPRPQPLKVLKSQTGQVLHYFSPFLPFKSQLLRVQCSLVIIWRSRCKASMRSTIPIPSRLIFFDRIEFHGNSRRVQYKLSSENSGMGALAPASREGCSQSPIFHSVRKLRCFVLVLIPAPGRT